MAASHAETSAEEELHLMGERRKWLLEVESTSGEGAGKTVEVTAKGLEHDMN